MSFCPACQSDYPDDWKRCPKDEQVLLRSQNVGKYQIDGVLGSGGMGSVYRAVNPDTGAKVAIKLLHDIAAGDEGARARFRREAASLAELTTRHVVRVFDFGEENSGNPFLVMEFLSGHTLRKEIRKPPEHMPLPRVNMVMHGALQGLAAAHRIDIVHRDLKPENLFIATTDDGEVLKVLDFGIARVNRKNTKALTQSGALMGTPAYMGPEQVSTSHGTVGPHSDTYGMGVILYEMLTGLVPFYSDSMPEVLTRVLSRDFKPLSKAMPELPGPVHQFSDRALAAEPDERFGDAEQMREAWKAAFDSFGSDVTGAPIPEFTPPPKELTELADTDFAVTPDADTVLGRPSHQREAGPKRPASAHESVQDGPVIPAPRRSRAGIIAGISVAVILASAAAIYVTMRPSDAPPHTDDAAPTPQTIDAATPTVDATPAVPGDMVAIKGGSFSMGVDKSEFPDYPDADPKHEVGVRSFYMDKTEFSAPDSNLPMREVSWFDADRLCREHGKRLPTEAEWEYAASQTELDPSGARLKTPGPSGPSPVGSHPGDCTPDGLCDMLGNVSEWTADVWRTPKQNQDDRYRTVRGASFEVAPTERFYATVKARVHLEPSQQDAEVGFRCARDP